jgi:hypothetical protein
MSFRSVFIALVIGFGLVLGGYLINSRRPRIETDQPAADFVRASGKCAEWHTVEIKALADELRNAHGKK